MPSDISRADLIAALLSLAADLDGTPTRKQMNDRGQYSAQPYYSEFGSWNAALAAAGLDTNHRNDIPDSELQQEMRRVADDLGRSPTFEEMADRGQFDPATYVRRWGSWLAAREACGLSGETEQFGRRADRPDLLAALRELGDESGRPPTQTEVRARSDYHPITYHRRFGSFWDALAAAGFDLDESHREWPTGYGSQSEWRENRETVRERDGYQCRVCGMAETDHKCEYGEELHVHHIGTAEDTDDMVTLCKQCHSKWDRTTADPRTQ